MSVEKIVYGIIDRVVNTLQMATQFEINLMKSEKALDPAHRKKVQELQENLVTMMRDTDKIIKKVDSGKSDYSKEQEFLCEIGRKTDEFKKELQKVIHEVELEGEDDPGKRLIILRNQGIEMDKDEESR